MRPPWSWHLAIKIKSINPWVQVCAKCARITSWHSWDIAFTRQKNCFVRSPWPWPLPNKIYLVHLSVQVIICSKFLPNLKKILQGVFEKWDRYKHNDSDHWLLPAPSPITNKLYTFHQVWCFCQIWVVYNYPKPIEHTFSLHKNHAREWSSPGTAGAWALITISKRRSL